MIKELMSKVRKNNDFQIEIENLVDEHLTEDLEIIKISPLRLTNSVKKDSFDASVFSGLNEIEVTKNFKPLSLKKRLFGSQIHEFIQNLKEEIKENSNNSDYKFSIFFKGKNGKIRLAWLPERDSWLVISSYTFNEPISFQDEEKSKYYFEFDRYNHENTEKAFEKILFEYLFIQNQRNFSEVSQDFRKYIRYGLKPFKDYLYLEKDLFSQHRYRPKCTYELKFKKKKDKTTEAYLKLNNPPSPLREAGNQISLVTHNSRLQNIRVFITDYDYNEDEIYIEEGERIEDWPKEGKIYLVGDLINNRRKLNAIRFLENYNNQIAVKLVDLLFRPNSLPKVFLKKIQKQFSDIDNVQFNESQTKAIDLALSTDDIGLIHGPPGTGKTTVICELIYRVLSKGKRVLLIAPTHVAVDNVLKMLKNVEHIYPVRLGGHRRVEKDIKKYLLSSRKREWTDLVPGLKSNPYSESFKGKTLRELQFQFVKRIKEEDKYYINDLIINQSNLVCGTTLGVARYLKTKSFDFSFDYLIIDESSKETFLNFLVPAIHAKKWILVGDYRQLPPYVDDNELRILVKEFIRKIQKRRKRKKEKNPNNSEEKVESFYTSLDSRIRFNPEKKTVGHSRKKKFQLKPPDIDRVAGVVRRYHEEYHALNQSNYVDKLWMKIVRQFNFDRILINKIDDFIKFSLGSVFHFFYERIDRSRNVKLNYQYRMPRIIAKFLDKNVYQGELKTRTQRREKINKPKLKYLDNNYDLPDYLTWLSTEKLDSNLEKKVGYSYQNKAEANVIVDLIKNLIKMDVRKWGYTKDNQFTIGVINYYAKQAKLIRTKLNNLNGNLIKPDGRWAFLANNQPIRIRVSIVDRFQGQEQNIIILSLTRSKKKGKSIGFTKNLQRANVSLSRAKHYMFIIGNHYFFNKNRGKKAPLLNKKANYVKSKNRVLILNSKIKESLPSDFKKFKSTYKKHKSKSFSKLDEFQTLNLKKYRNLIFSQRKNENPSYLSFYKLDKLKELISTLFKNNFRQIKNSRTLPNEVLFRKEGKHVSFLLTISLLYVNTKGQMKFGYNYKVNPICPICLDVFREEVDFKQHFRDKHLK